MSAWKLAAVEILHLRRGKSPASCARLPLSHYACFVYSIIHVVSCRDVALFVVMDGICICSAL